MSLTLQYIIVGLILAGAAVFIILRLQHLRKDVKQTPCCGCALSDSCNKNKKNKGCHENNKNME